MSNGDRVFAFELISSEIYFQIYFNIISPLLLLILINKIDGLKKITLLSMAIIISGIMLSSRTQFLILLIVLLSCYRLIIDELINLSLKMKLILLLLFAISFLYIIILQSDRNNISDHLTSLLISLFYLEVPNILILNYFDGFGGGVLESSCFPELDLFLHFIDRDNSAFSTIRTLFSEYSYFIADFDMWLNQWQGTFIYSYVACGNYTFSIFLYFSYYFFIKILAPPAYNFSSVKFLLIYELFFLSTFLYGFMLYKIYLFGYFIFRKFYYFNKNRSIQNIKV